MYVIATQHAPSNVVTERMCKSLKAAYGLLGLWISRPQGVKDQPNPLKTYLAGARDAGNENWNAPENSLKGTHRGWFIPSAEHQQARVYSSLTCGAGGETAGAAARFATPRLLTPPNLNEDLDPCGAIERYR